MIFSYPDNRGYQYFLRWYLDILVLITRIGKQVMINKNPYHFNYLSFCNYIQHIYYANHPEKHFCRNPEYAGENNAIY
jgi:hypothetical protein